MNPKPHKGNDCLEFGEWLLINYTPKLSLSPKIGYFWTLNKDYQNSWDGEDIKCYSTEQIFEIYKNTLNS